MDDSVPELLCGTEELSEGRRRVSISIGSENTGKEMRRMEKMEEYSLHGALEFLKEQPGRSAESPWNSFPVSRCGRRRLRTRNMSSRAKFSPAAIMWWKIRTRTPGMQCRNFRDITGGRCHPLDPSSSPEYSPSIRDVGISCKTIFDCTEPFGQKDRFRRAQFLKVDPAKWVPGHKV